MHLIAPLVAGIAGAENGTAEVYVHRTSTRATVYADFEGVSPDASGDDIELDDNGGAVVYVNRVVNVIVRDAQGTTLREFVAGVNATAVEVIHPSFTGTDYISASTTLNEPTTLQAILTSIGDSFGGPDAEIPVGGLGSATIGEWITRLDLQFYNVKSSQFGALGDGVTDDSAAIQDAIDTAAAADGGRVFFPPGVYRVANEVTWDRRVELVGAGPGVCTLALENNSASLFVVQPVTTDGEGCRATGFRFAFGITGATEPLFDAPSANCIMELRQCILDDSNRYSSAPLVEFSGSGSSVLLSGVTVLLGSPTGIAVSERLTIEGGSIVYSGGPLTFGSFAASALELSAIGVFVDCSAATSSSATIFGADSSLVLHAVRTNDTGGGSLTLGSDPEDHLNDGGCVLGDGVTPVFATNLASSGVLVASREPRVLTLTDNGTTLDVSTDFFFYSTVTIIRTGGAGQTLTVASPGMPNMRARIIYHNNTAGSLALTFGSGYRAPASPYTTNANTVSIFNLIYVRVNSTEYWYVESVAQNMAE